MIQQQLLDLFNQEYDFNNFIASGNEIIVANLQNFSSQFTHIFGDHLTGKTHLIKSWVNLANTKYHSSIYIDAVTEKNIDIEHIERGGYRFIAIDNIDKLSDEGQIELFNLFNHIKLNSRNNYLLTSSSVNLNHAELRVDLKTRLQSGMVFGLKNLTEDELLNALSIYTKREGIKFGNAELQYLLTHYTRNLGKLLALINHIGDFATMQKKPITTHLIKNVLNLQIEKATII